MSAISPPAGSGAAWPSDSASDTPRDTPSEAANAYYGAYLLALSLGDVALADWCRTLLAMEVRAAREQELVGAEATLREEDIDVVASDKHLRLMQLGEVA